MCFTWWSSKKKKEQEEKNVQEENLDLEILNLATNDCAICFDSFSSLKIRCSWYYMCIDERCAKKYHMRCWKAWSAVDRRNGHRGPVMCIHCHKRVKNIYGI